MELVLVHQAVNGPEDGHGPCNHVVVYSSVAALCPPEGHKSRSMVLNDDLQEGRVLDWSLTFDPGNMNPGVSSGDLDTCGGR
jgi:hypothetical protein